MSSTTQIEDAAARTTAPQPLVRVARKHHLLVRISHWVSVLLLTGLIVSGISIYWASPVSTQAGPAEWQLRLLR